MIDGSIKAEIIEGQFKRQEDHFRNWVSRDGSSGYPAATGRYHLYVSLACPWAHRTIIVRQLKKLQAVIGMSVVDPIRSEAEGWAFRAPYGEDPVNGFHLLSQAYRATEPGYSGRVTVPVLWDGQTGRIVSNADEDIIRMFTSAFDDFTDSELDLYPEDLQPAIDQINEPVYEYVNNGVYRAGFADSQRAYEQAVHKLFDALDQLEGRLAGQRYLAGDRITEADWRLFPTLIRFDEVYHGHFKCNIRRLVDYPNLWGYTRELYQVEGVAATVDFDHIKRHYYTTHDDINPTGIVPVGPGLDLLALHGRDRAY